MRINIFIIISIAIFFLNATIVKAAKFECQEGYVKSTKHDIMGQEMCYNPDTHLSYSVSSHDNTPYYFYLHGVECGVKCNFDGKNCKTGFCNEKELKENGYEINTKIYNPKTHLTYRDNGYFSLNYICCGYQCNLDGTNCKTGFCDEKELIRHGYTEIKDGKFYNPKSHLAYNCNYFYLNNTKCGEECDLDGTNCERGFCNIKDCKNGYTEIKDGNCYNPDTHLSYNAYKHFFIDGIKCGYGCDLDGTNCASGFCNIKSCKKGYTEINGGNCYNPETHLSYNAYKHFFIDGIKCGYGCDLDGKNCVNGNCEGNDNVNINEIKKHGYTETKDYYYRNNRSYPEGKNFYNPETHIAFHGNYFYLEYVPCGYKCDLDGRNCEQGICVVDDCSKGYKNLDIYETGYWTFEASLFAPYIESTYSVICHNNSKTRYYNVFDSSENKKMMFVDKIKLFFGFFTVWFK